MVALSFIYLVSVGTFLLRKAVQWALKEVIHTCRLNESRKRNALRSSILFNHMKFMGNLSRKRGILSSKILDLFS